MPAWNHRHDERPGYGEVDPMALLADHIERDPTRRPYFRRAYGGKFTNMTEFTRRPVLFFGPDGLAEFEKRQVPIRHRPNLFRSVWSVHAHHPMFINGPTGSGKSCFGMFDIATSQQLLVYVGAPPPLHTPHGTGVSRRVAACITEAEQALEADAGDNNYATGASAFYCDALQLHILDVLEQRIGKRLKVRRDETIEVIFFFDGFSGHDSTNDRIVRRAIRRLWPNCSHASGLAFEEALRADFGLKLFTVVLEGTGLEMDIPPGSSNCCSSGGYFTPAPWARWEWSDITDKQFEEETVSARVEAELAAVLELPRLAALMLQCVSFCDTLNKKLMFRCVPLVVSQFANISMLSTLVGDPQARHEVGLQCLRVMLYVPRVNALRPSRPTGFDESACSLIEHHGIAFVKTDGHTFECTVGPAQRLLLREFFELTKNADPGMARGFTFAVACFMCFAAAASHGKTVAEFVAALAAFLPLRRENRSVRSPNVRVPDAVQAHVLHASGAEVVHLEELDGEPFQVSPDCATVLVNSRDGGIPWDVQLVLPVTAPGAADVEYVTFDLKAVPYLTQHWVDYTRSAGASSRTQVMVPGARHAGAVVVVGRFEEGVELPPARSVWQVDLRDPGSLGVVPFPSRCADETRPCCATA